MFTLRVRTLNTELFKKIFFSCMVLHVKGSTKRIKYIIIKKLF